MNGGSLQQAWQPQQPLTALAKSSADRFMRCCFAYSAFCAMLPTPPHQLMFQKLYSVQCANRLCAFGAHAPVTAAWQPRIKHIACSTRHPTSSTRAGSLRQAQE